LYKNSRWFFTIRWIPNLLILSKLVLKEAPSVAMEQSHHICQYVFETIIALHHPYQTVILNQIYNDNQDEMSDKKGGGSAQTTLHQKIHDVDRPTINDSLAGNRTPASCELFFRMTSRNTDHYTTKDSWVIDERHDLNGYYIVNSKSRTRAVPLLRSVRFSILQPDWNFARQVSRTD
jgi:hypothetical protein